MTYEAVIGDNQVCTCFPIENDNHDPECDLWSSPGWRAGLLAWDPKEKVMYAVDSGYYELTDEEVRDYVAYIGGPDPFDDEEDTKHSAFIVQQDGEIVPVDEPDPDEADDLDEYLRKRFEGVDAAIDEATKKHPPTKKEKADSAFEKLRKAAKGVVDKMTAAHDSKLPECTCQDPDAAIPLKFNHLTSCAIAKFPPWIETDCEWEHNNRRFLWYSPTVLDKTKVDPYLTVPPYDVHEFKSSHAAAQAKKEKSGTKETYGGNSNGKWSNDWEYGGSFGFTGGYQKCRHYEQEVVFPDGTKVIASSQFTRKAGESVPDDALYVASSWTPTSLATYLPWIDHGLPAIRWDHAVGIIIEKFEKAKQGWTVEVGCIGGHGRTGSVLACMAILAGVAPDEACAWVWANYCEQAIESDSQIWWIEWFASKVSDWPEPLPPEQVYNSADPKPPPKKTTTQAKVGSRKVDPDVPACRECGTERKDDETFLCSNSKCKPNYTMSIKGEHGAKQYDKWKAKFAKERKAKDKAKTPPKAKVPAEHAGPPVDPDNPICKGCSMPRVINQVHICNNEACKPNYQIPSDSPRGQRILARWRGEEERKK